MIKAIFFDLDGVLVDSETVHQKITEEFLKKENSILPPHRFYHLIGSSKGLNPWPQIVEGYTLQEPIEELRKRLSAYKQERLKSVCFYDLVFAEVKEVLLQLKAKHITLACASSSSMEHIRDVLQEDLYELFDLVVTGEDFQRSKPAPDIYLHCLHTFGYHEKECLVVEDSPIGIEAGKSAKIQVVARIDTQFGLDQSAADFYIKDLTMLFDIIKQQ